MTWRERMTIIQALKPVTMAIVASDKDDTVCETLKWIHKVFKSRYDEILFCNGGDRTIDGDKPEHKLCLSLGVKPVYGLGDKIQSSSWLIAGDDSLEALESRVANVVKGQDRQSNAGSLFF